MIHLARAFRDHPEVRYGITTMCIGLGMGGTVVWENPGYTAEQQGRARERGAASATSSPPSWRRRPPPRPTRS